MTKGDLIVERGAARLQELARRAGARGDGVGEWLAEELTQDAAFLLKLKPSLIAARARGQAPTNVEPGTAPADPQAPQFGKRPKKTKRRKGVRGPAPLLVVGIAFAAGIVLAKVVNWRGNAHSRN